MNTDARVIVTKRLIREAFFSLLQKKELSKITVKELCAAAHVNRGTFYKHYLDIDGFIEEIEAEHIDMLKRNAKNGLDIQAISSIVLRQIQENRDPIRLFLQSGIKQKFLNDIFDITFSHFSEVYPSVCAKHGAYGIHFAIGGSTQLVAQWIDNGYQEDADFIAAKIQEFVDCIQS